MKNYFTGTIAGISIILALFISSCADKGAAPAYQSGPVPVVTQEVKLSQVSYFDEFPGTVVALNQVELRAQVNGYVTGIY